MEVLPKFHFLPNMRYKAKVLTARMMNMSYLTYNELINVFFGTMATREIHYYYCSKYPVPLGKFRKLERIEEEFDLLGI
jgi:hypothetical protein